MKNEFTTFDVANILKISRERLHDWMMRTYIKPSVPADGQGTKAVFSLHDLYFVALFQALIGNGFSREISGRLVKGYMEEEQEQEKKAKNGHGTLSETDYILFRVPIDKKGPVNVISLHRAYDERYAFKLSLESGLPYTEASKAFRASPKSVEFFAELERKGIPGTDINTNWSFIHVVNFKAICEMVDKIVEKM